MCVMERDFRCDHPTIYTPCTHFGFQHNRIFLRKQTRQMFNCSFFKTVVLEVISHTTFVPGWWPARPLWTWARISSRYCRTWFHRWPRRCCQPRTWRRTATSRDRSQGRCRGRTDLRCRRNRILLCVIKKQTYHFVFTRSISIYRKKNGG